MSLPLTVAPDLLARAAIARTPRLAALLSNAQRAKVPVMVTRHCRDPFDHFLGSLGLTARWAGNVAQFGMAVGGAMAAIDIASSLLNQQGSKPAKTPIHAIYDDLMGGERNSSFKLKSASEQIEALKPSAAGENAATEKFGSEEFNATRESELTLLSSSIVSVGFENLVDRIKSGGAFDAAVLSNVRAAANVIAPNRLVSQMTDLERRAITTSAIFGSNATFLHQMRAQTPELDTPTNRRTATQLLDVAKALPSAEKFAQGLMANGSVSSELFAALTPGVAGTGASGLLAMSPVGIKLALISAAVTKANHAIKAVTSLMDDMKHDGEHKPISGWMSAMFSAARSSLKNRDARFRETEQPQDRDAIPAM